MARRTVIMPVGAQERVAGSKMVVVRRRVMPPAAVGPTITAPGSLSGSAFRIGTSRTITPGTATPSGGGTISYQFRWLVDGASAATTAAYTPLAGNDGDAIVAQWRAVETGGTSPGETGWQTVGSGTITYAPPTFSTQPAFGAASYSIGQTVTFTEGVAGPAAVLTVEEFRLGAVDKRGELSGTSWDTAGESAGTITLRIRATNSGGSVLSNSITAGLSTIPITDYAREFSRAIGSVAIALSGIGPAESGTATYAPVGSLGTGNTLSGSTLTIDTATAASSTVTVRRTDGAGQRDLRLTLTMVTWSITRVGAGPDFEFISGADDPGATTYALTLTGGPRNGQTISVTQAQIAALATNAALLAAVPIIGLTTDTDSDGALDASDVATLAAAAVRVFRAGETIPASTYQWRDAGGAIAGATGSSYTGAGTEATTVRLRETVGAAFVDSATVPVGGAGTGITAATDGITFTFAPSMTVQVGTDGITLTAA